MYLKDYAMSILREHGCDKYTYGGVDGETILRDLKEAYPNGMEFPYIDVVNMIISVSRMKKIDRPRWKVLWDTGDCCDSYATESLAQGKMDALDTLINWMSEVRAEWKDYFHPTKYELEEYNYMICDSSVEVCRYNNMTDEYEEFWTPSDKDLENIGWKELTRKDIAEEQKACDAFKQLTKEEV